MAPSLTLTGRSRSLGLHLNAFKRMAPNSTKLSAYSSNAERVTGCSISCNGKDIHCGNPLGSRIAMSHRHRKQSAISLPHDARRCTCSRVNHIDSRHTPISLVQLYSQLMMNISHLARPRSSPLVSARSRSISLDLARPRSTPLVDYTSTDTCLPITPNRSFTSE